MIRTQCSSSGQPSIIIKIDEIPRQYKSHTSYCTVQVTATVRNHLLNRDIPGDPDWPLNAI